MNVTVSVPVAKYVNELYADVFARIYGFNIIGLRYFNVFGPHQDPDGAQANFSPGTKAKWGSTSGRSMSESSYQTKTMPSASSSARARKKQWSNMR